MIYIVTIAIILVCIIVQTSIVRHKGILGLINNPFSLSLIFYELIHLIMPLLQWHNNYFRYSTNYSEVTYTLSIILVFFLFLTYAFLFFYKYNFFGASQSILFLNSNNAKRFLIFSWIVFLIGGYFSFKNILAIQSIGVDDYLKDRIGFSAGAGYKILFSHWVYVANILFFIGFLIANKNKYFIFSFLISLIYCFIYYGMNSNRNSLFVLFFTLLVLYISFYSGRKIKFTNFINKSFYGFIFLLAFYLIGQFRNKSVTSNIESEYGLINSLNGAFGNHENIVWLLSNKYELLLGNTYIASFLNVIPRTLWPDKPYGAGPELKNMIYPGSYILGQEGNSSLTTGLFTEVLMNFGILGSFPAIFFISCIVFIFLVVLKKLENPIGKIIYIYLFTLLSTQFFYAEFLGFYTRTIFTCIPILLLAFFIKFERKPM